LLSLFVPQTKRAPKLPNMTKHNHNVKESNNP
jgi:hypothetical protein